MISLKIDDRKNNISVSFFNDISINLRYDSVGSTFAFRFYFNPDNADHKIFAAVGQYQLARLYFNDQLLLTGFILSQAFNSSAKKDLVSFGGYSVPGVLEDSQIPLSAYPLQNDGLSLRQITEKILRPFQIIMDVDDDPVINSGMDRIYDKTTANATETVKDYLVSLASQRNIVISHTPRGHLLFTRAKTDQEPILHFEKGVIGTTYSLSFNGQTMHSPITVIKQADADGGNASEYTLKNPYVPESTTAFRPKVVEQSSGDDNDTRSAAENVLFAELKGIQLKITTDRWVVNNKFITPNNVITITDPELFLYEKTKFFIESVEYTANSTGEIATLTCVLPEVYVGDPPTKNIFVQ